VAFKKPLLFLLIPCLLAGCTASFTYNHLDWLIPWYVNGYVDLTRDQRKSLRAQLEPFLAWHRAEELERYIEILDNVEETLIAPVTGEQVHSWIDEAVEAAERTGYSMFQLVLEFGAGLSDEQMQEFVDSLWEQQRDYEEEFLERTDQEYVEDNHEELVDFLKQLIGRLSSDQKARLLVAAQSLCRFDRPWLVDSEEWLNKLQPLLLRDSGWQAKVEAAFLARKSDRSPEFRTCIDENYRVISSAVADVLNQASERQRDHLFEEIRDLRTRLQKLIDADVGP
jgi:hypothetical protein